MINIPGCYIDYKYDMVGLKIHPIFRTYHSIFKHNYNNFVTINKNHCQVNTFIYNFKNQ